MERSAIGVGLVVVGLLVAIGTAGCAPNRITPEYAAKLTAVREVALVKRKGPPLQMQKISGMITAGAVAALTGVSFVPNVGYDIQRQYQLDDPMNTVMPAVLKRLKEQYQVDVQMVPTDENSLKPSKRYRLDFGTIEWSMGTQYAADTLLNYTYTAQIALIDTSKDPNEDLWRVECGVDEKSPNAPKGARLDELTGDGAALLKQRIADANERCIRTLFEAAPLAVKN